MFDIQLNMLLITSKNTLQFVDKLFKIIKIAFFIS